VLRASGTIPARLIRGGAAMGLCISRGPLAVPVPGTSKQKGLQASYVSAVAFIEEDILVADYTAPLRSPGAVYSDDR